MHDAVKNSPVGLMIGRLIGEEFARDGDTSYPKHQGNVIQDLWIAFMAGQRGAPIEDASEVIEFEDCSFDSLPPPSEEIQKLMDRRLAAKAFREIKEGIKDGSSL